MKAFVTCFVYLQNGGSCSQLEAHQLRKSIGWIRCRVQRQLDSREMRRWKTGTTRPLSRMITRNALLGIPDREIAHVSALGHGHFAELHTKKPCSSTAPQSKYNSANRLTERTRRTALWYQLPLKNGFGCSQSTVLGDIRLMLPPRCKISPIRLC